MESIDDRIISRIYGHQRGWIFSKNDFLDIAGDAATRKALSRLEQKGTIRRVLRGVYDYPRISTLFNEAMGPDMDALNVLELSTQVPAQSVYLSDGPSKTYEVGNRQLLFKKRSLKESGYKHCESELVVQALKALGKERIDDKVYQRLSKKWTPTFWQKILRDTKTAPAWVCDVIRHITKEAAR